MCVLPLWRNNVEYIILTLLGTAAGKHVLLPTRPGTGPPAPDQDGSALSDRQNVHKRRRSCVQRGQTTCIIVTRLRILFHQAQNRRANAVPRHGLKTSPSRRTR